MSTGRGFLAGIITSAAVYAAYKALPDERKNELKEKAKEVGDQISDRAIDLVYSASDTASDLKDKADRVINSGESDDQKVKEIAKEIDVIEDDELIRDLADLEEN